MKHIADLGKKLVELTEIERYFNLYDYQDLVAFIHKQVELGTIEPVKASQFNGMNPPLYNRYRLNVIDEDLSHLASDINLNFPLLFSRNYYLDNLKKYQEDREYITQLIHYNREKQFELKIPMSINERSFAIFGVEKFMKEGRGKTILKNLGLELEFLNIYTTPEPFVYFSVNKESNQTILIIENKDTWYTIRKLMLEGQRNFLGSRIDSIIYGAGKNIEKSLEEYEFTVEPYLLSPALVLYWGDLDYEGILIYERLKERYKHQFTIQLFNQAYLKMLELSQSFKLPISSEKQNKQIGDDFINEMKRSEILNLLKSGHYIPQEIVNYLVLKEER